MATFAFASPRKRVRKGLDIVSIHSPGTSINGVIDNKVSTSYRLKNRW
jgi:hypothetical protein